MMRWLKRVAWRLYSATPLCRVPERVEQILVVMLGGIGDAVMFSPALRVLRRRFPSAHLTALVADRRGTDGLLVGPELADDCIAYDIRADSPCPDAALVERLGRRRFDLAVSAQASYWTPGTLKAAGVRYVVGFRYRLGRTVDSAYRLECPVRRDLAIHQSEQFLDLVRSLGADGSADELLVSVSEEDADWAQNHLAALGPGPWLAVQAGCHPAHAEKAWPVERWIELGRLAHERPGLRMLVVGDERDRASAEAIGRGVDEAATCIGQTTRQTAAIIRGCAAFVGADSGIAHLAAAVGTCVVALFGPTSTALTAPRGPGPVVVITGDCDLAPCHVFGKAQIDCKRDGECMRSISAERVAQALAALVESRA